MIELNRIYNEDCLDGMKRIPDGSVDCIICDLPYGTTKNKFDKIIPIEKIWEQYKRVIKHNGAIILFAQIPFMIELAHSNLDMLKYEWVWEKAMPTGFLNCNFAPLKCHENILVFSKSSACYVKDKSRAMIYNPLFRNGKPYKFRQRNAGNGNYDSKNMIDCTTINDGTRYYPRDVIRFGRDKEKLHPTQKPVALIEYLIKTYSNEGETVLDNCMGSGTTAIACINTNRNFIGFELNKEFYDISLKRIEEHEHRKER